MAADRRQRERRGKVAQRAPENEQRRKDQRNDRRTAVRRSQPGFRPDGANERRDVCLVVPAVPDDVARVRIDVTDTVDVDVTPTYRLRGEAAKPGGIVIVALPRFGREFAYLDPAMLRSAGGVRAMPRLTPDQVRSCLSAFDKRMVYTATDQPVRHGSVISARWRTRIERDDHRLGLRRFRPLSKLVLGLRPNPLVSLSVHLPPIASASCVVVTVRISLAPVLVGRKRDVLQELNIRPLARVETTAERERAAEIHTAFSQLRAELRTLLDDLSTRTNAHAAKLLAELPRSAGRDARRVLTELRSVNEGRIAAKHALLDEEPPAPPENADDDLERFLAYEAVLGGAVKDAVELDLPLSFQTGEDIARPIRSILGPALAVNCEYQRLAIPFTTEREPGTQGLRSAASLLFLGAFMLLMSRCDLSWVPSAARLGGYDASWYRPPPNAGGLIEPLVAVLLIFPAALYGQFFQTRPRTDIGNSSQLSSFALHSFLFSAPIIAAILAATGRDLATVSIANVIIGCVATFVGLRLLRTYSGSRLEGLRYAELAHFPRRPSLDAVIRSSAFCAVFVALFVMKRTTNLWSVGAFGVVLVAAALWVALGSRLVKSVRRFRAGVHAVPHGAADGI